MQTPDFRSTTNLRALAMGRSRSDNTFTTARNLGRIPVNATRVSFRARSTVGKSDTVDFYKFTVDPGVNLRFGRNSYRLKNGSATFSRYVTGQGRKVLLGTKFTLRPGKTTYSSSVTNPTQSPVTFYLKVERQTGETRYNLAFDFFR